MSLPIGSQQRSSDGVIGTSGKKIRLYQIIVHSGASGGVVQLRNGTTTGGTEYDEVNGTASISVSASYAGGLFFPDGLFIDLDANTVYVTCIFEQENG